MELPECAPCISVLKIPERKDVLWTYLNVPRALVSCPKDTRMERRIMEQLGCGLLAAVQ